MWKKLAHSYRPLADDGPGDRFINAYERRKEHQRMRRQGTGVPAHENGAADQQACSINRVPLERLLGEIYGCDRMKGNEQQPCECKNTTPSHPFIRAAPDENICPPETNRQD